MKRFVAALLCAVSFSVCAQEYPSKPVRVLVPFEDMRQHHEVHALRGERELERVGGERRPRFEREREAEGNAVLLQEIDLRQPDLHRAEAEDILDRAVKLCTFPV